LAHQKEQRLRDGEKQNFHRSSLNGRTDGPGYRAVVIKVTVQDRGARQVRRHEDDLQIDAFVFEEAPVQGGIKRKERDIG
jgi:hypothetical protein